MVRARFVMATCNDSDNEIPTHHDNKLYVDLNSVLSSYNYFFRKEYADFLKNYNYVNVG
jgi:hypothetical protein